MNNPGFWVGTCLGGAAVITALSAMILSDRLSKREAHRLRSASIGLWIAGFLVALFSLPKDERGWLWPIYLSVLLALIFAGRKRPE